MRLNEKKGTREPASEREGSEPTNCSLAGRAIQTLGARKLRKSESRERAHSAGRLRVARNWLLLRPLVAGRLVLANLWGQKASGRLGARGSGAARQDRSELAGTRSGPAHSEPDAKTNVMQ